MSDPCLACVHGRPNTLSFIHCDECHANTFLAGRYDFGSCGNCGKAYMWLHYRSELDNVVPCSCEPE